MARPRNNEKHIMLAVESLVASVTGLIRSLQAAVPAAGRSTAFIPPRKGQRGPGKNNPRLKAAITASWARMTKAERKARVRKMLAGRGLKPKQG